MAEDLWTTISRYYWSTDKKFVFNNESTYEWYIFEWFMKNEFRNQFLSDVVGENHVSTTDCEANSDARTNQKQSSEDDRRQSPAIRRTYAEAASERTSRAATPTEDLNTRKLRNRAIPLPNATKASSTTTEITEDSNNVDEADEGRNSSSREASHEDDLTMEDYRKEVVKLKTMAGNERTVQLETLKYFREQLVLEGKFKNVTMNTEKVVKEDNTKNKTALEQYELKCAKIEKAMNLFNKHVNLSILTTTMRHHGEADPKLIWRDLKKRFRTNEVTTESYMRDTIGGFEPDKNQSFESFMNVIDIAYKIVENIRGNEVSELKKKENLRIMMNQENVNNINFQVLRIQASLNKDLSYEQMLATLCELEKDNKNIHIENITKQRQLRQHEKKNHDTNEKPRKENYKHINYAERSYSKNTKPRYDTPQRYENRERHNNRERYGTPDNNKSDNKGEYTDKRYNNKRYEYEKRSNTPERGHKPYTKGSNYKYDKYYNSKPNKRPYTSYDRANTPPPKQEYNRSQNNSYDKQPNKKKVDFKENSEKDMYCIEVLDGPDDDNDNDIDDEGHVYMSQKVHKKPVSPEDMSSSESSDEFEFINSSTESSTLNEDEEEQEDEKVEFNMLDIVPFTPTPLEDQMNKMLRALEKDIDIPIHTESYYRTTLKRMLFGFVMNQEFLKEGLEFNHTKVLDNLIMLYGGIGHTEYDVILPIVVHPFLRKALYTNNIPHEIRLRVELFHKTLMNKCVRLLKQRRQVSNKYVYKLNDLKNFTKQEELSLIRYDLLRILNKLSNKSNEWMMVLPIQQKLENLNPEYYLPEIKQEIINLIEFVRDHVDILRSDDYILQKTTIPCNVYEHDIHIARITGERKPSYFKNKTEEYNEKDYVTGEPFITLTTEEQEKYKEGLNKVKGLIYHTVQNPKDRTYHNIRRFHKYREQANEKDEKSKKRKHKRHKHKRQQHHHHHHKHQIQHEQHSTIGEETPLKEDITKNIDIAHTEELNSTEAEQTMNAEIEQIEQYKERFSTRYDNNRNCSSNEDYMINLNNNSTSNIEAYFNEELDETPRRRSKRLLEKKTDEEEGKSPNSSDQSKRKRKNKRKKKKGSTSPSSNIIIKEEKLLMATISKKNFITFTQKMENDVDIIIDSGASVHMFRNPTLLFNIRKKITRIRFGNGKLETYKLVGDAGLLKDIVLTTRASKNIISIGKLTELDFTVSISNTRAYIRDKDNELISTATKRSDGLLYLDDMNIIAPLANECYLTKQEEIKGAVPNRMAKFYAGMNPINVLHNRFGHINEKAIKSMLSSNSVIGAGYDYKDIKDLHMETCDACMKGKMTKLPAYSTLQPTDYKVFEKVGADLVGKMKVMSMQGNKYMILYIDYHSSYIIPYFVTKKSELLDTIKGLYDEVKERGQKIGILQSDSESVFKDGKVIDWCCENGIDSQYSPAYFHEANGKTERAIRTIITMARTMMLAADAPANLWEYAIIYAVRIYNRTPKPNLDMKTPHEIVFEQKPDISGYIPFFAKGWTLKYKDEKKRKGKFDSVSETCRFIGIPHNSKNSFLIKMDDGRVIVRRDCQFDEHPKKSTIEENVTDPYENNDVFPSEGAYDSDVNNESDSSNSSNSDSNDSSDSSDSEDGRENKVNNNQQTIKEAKKTTTDHQNIQRPHRQRQIPKHLQQYIHSTEVITDIPTPKTVKEALHPNNKYREEWRKAIEKEMDEMWNRGSLVKVDIEEVKRNNRKPFKSKFVFKVKNEPDGSVRFKARLVGCGYSQIKGIDYTYTYAPTPGFHLVIIILHISIINNWTVIANDIGNAYLEAQADTLLYMNLPKDYTNGLQQVVRLDGNINGTKQGALLWANVIDDVLIKFNCIRSKIEPCLYIYKDREDIIYIIIYVDDILMTSNSITQLDRIQKHLAESFKKVTSQGEVRKFLGVQIKKEIINEIKYLTLHHNDYIIEKMKNINATRNKDTPLPMNIQQLKNDENDKIDPIHDLVGQIRFLADRCRPDVAFAASFLARFSISATQQQINACHRVFQYLNLTKEDGIKVGSRSKEITLTAYADASFATEEDSKSQLCYALYLAQDSGACLFKSWKDKTVSTSSTHAEIHALFETIKTIVWYRELLKEIGYEQLEPTLIYQDNINVVNLSDYSAKDNMTKFLINKINFIREAINEKIIILKHINSENMIADIGTKSLDVSTHNRLKEPLLKGYELLFNKNIN